MIMIEIESYDGWKGDNDLGEAVARDHEFLGSHGDIITSSLTGKLRPVIRHNSAFV